MFPKKKRISRGEFANLAKKSKKIEGEGVSLRVHLPTNDDNYKYAVVISSKVLEKAVERSLYKRRVYAILKKNEKLIRASVIVYLNKEAKSMPNKELEADIVKTLKKI
jgi:ribonuclease P protein component